MTLASKLLTLLSLFLLISLVRSQVPPLEQFRFLNNGDFGESTVEYGASYRDLGVIRNQFRLCFFNTTPNEFTLGIGMGTGRSDSIIRWVWQANPQNPVQEEASLSFGPEGNLVLAQPNGKVVWQTKTENKGVIGLTMNENGNLVLFNDGGWPVWQSFDFPTDTLLVVQSLTLDGPNKLISRNNRFSLILEPDRLVLSHSIPKSNNKSVLYYAIEGRFIPTATLYAAKDQGTATQLGLAIPGLRPEFPYKHVLARPRFNASQSFLRLDADGNLRIYTFDFKVTFLPWEVTFELFNHDNNECMSPSKCGEFGICENNQCVACPLEVGLQGWSKACKPKKVKSCDPKTFHYYRLGGVDHFMTKYNAALAVGESKCRGSCSRDCKCLGFFYDKSSSKCWIGFELGTLVKVSDSRKVAYIKTPNV
ncbi:PREDICTED: epidermis-specific secreted glycoprotein EP1-like [Camelina sativa]|uniref:Epidermis-specific secreted glycoprotein EP1-like n=1 Tax=Camelina sativa TaxID=90675 RepID=A0ABM0YA80_CAMSA|nr:PREDICTED: epidermis-specific secreted glycoprotein EP1-like [Camelina sativa]